MQETQVTTIGRHIAEQERLHPEATGAFSNILYDIALAAKMISRAVSKAGLVDVLGGTGDWNAQGEAVQKLDAVAQDVIVSAMDHAGNLCCMVSEEEAEIIQIPAEFPKGEYVLLFDPLDGSSNIDVNVSIGTIFSIHQKSSVGAEATESDALQPGRRQVAAGYVLYGSSTMLVYSSGASVHGFTLDPSIGEFLLSHPNIRIPESSATGYSTNEANHSRWSVQQRRLLDHFKRKPEVTSRYVGSLVADFHRTLLQGGIFMYPADSRYPEGKLRLLYEAAPLAFICERAGGSASSGAVPVLDLVPRSLHQRTPLYIGSAHLVSEAESLLSKPVQERTRPSL